jgi:hypothetical protein
MVNNVYKITSLIVIIFLLQTCYVFMNTHQQKQVFEYCYDGENLKLEELLNINGYFEFKVPYVRTVTTPNKNLSHSLPVTLNENLIFFKDGTVCDGFYDFEKELRPDSLPNINLLFNEIKNNPNGKVSKIFKNVFRWGIYKLTGDTIKAQFIHHTSRLDVYWTAYEIWYKIIDRNNIKEIFKKTLNKRDQVIRKYEYYEGKFIPTDYLPPSDCRLKNYKWFWCETKKIKK